MRRGVAMARLACDATLCERRTRKVIATTRQRHGRAAGMAMKAGRIHLQGERHFLRVERLGIHVPAMCFRVPVHRALEPEAVSLEEICTTAMARPYVVDKTLLTSEIHRPFALRPIVREPHFLVAQKQPILYARRLVKKLARKESLGCFSTGARHGGSFVAVIDLLMAFSADGVGRLLSSCARNDEQEN